MINYTVGTNFNFELLQYFDSLNQASKCNTRIIEVYGSLASGDPIGTSREPERLSKVSMEELEQFVKTGLSYNIKTVYASNNLLIDIYYLETHYDEIIQFVKWLNSIGINDIILASPLMMEFIKSEFPHMNIHCSTILEIRSIQQVKYFSTIAKRLILAEEINRDFSLLKAIRKATDKELEVLVNEYCVLHCPVRTEHFIIQGLANRRSKWIISCEKCKISKIYPFNVCLPYMKRDLLHNLFARWIRPEDVEYYNKEIGISHFKIVGRTYPTERMKIITKAYMELRYDGNFFDLGPYYLGEKEAIRGLYIDNRKLDNFLDYFKQNEVRCNRDCEITCNYCKTFLYKILEIDLEKRDVNNE